MKVTIKQASREDINQPKFQSKYGEYSMQPMSKRGYRIPKGPDNRYITGLTAEEEAEIGQQIGQDVSSLSPFWKTQSIIFDVSSGSMEKEDTNPYDRIFLSVAKANNWLAEDREDLLTEHRYIDTIFYIYDKEVQSKRKSQLNMLNDEVGSILNKMSQNRDKMFFILTRLGKFVSAQSSESNLYNQLTEIRHSKTKAKDLEDFKRILEIPNEELQATYYVSEARKLKVIPMDVSSGVYIFNGKSVGKTVAELQKYFSAKKNEQDLMSLINEVKEIKGV